MKMSTHRYGLPLVAIWLVALLNSYCVQPPEYPIEPVLLFEGISRDTIIQGSSLEDSLSVFLSFTDGDGDIAPNASDTVPNVYLINRRTDQEVSTFQLDPIPEEGAENGISGDLRLRVYTTCCDYPDFVNAFPCTPTQEYPVDTLLLEAYIVDRAGNESNRVDLTPIILRCNVF